MTPVGEYCRIWNPEEHELAELVPIHELDAKLFAAGLPHLWDLLYLEPLVTALIPPLAPMGGTKALLEFLRTLRESPLAGMGFASGGGTGNGGVAPQLPRRARLLLEPHVPVALEVAEAARSPR